MGRVPPPPPPEGGAPRATCGSPCEVCRQLRTSAVVVTALLGLTEVSEERLAARVGEGPDVFSVHMGSAEACLVAAHDHAIARLQREWELSFANAGTWREG